MKSGVEILAPFGWGVQIAFVVVVVFMCYKAISRGEYDRKNGGSGAALTPAGPPPMSPDIVGLPAWAVMGPVSDAMGAIHNMAEEARNINAKLADVCRLLHDLDEGQKLTHKMLEDIRNNQQMRTDHKPRREL